MRISDWSSDVCSSDLAYPPHADRRSSLGAGLRHHRSDPGRMMAKKKKAADEGSWGKLVRDIVVILLLVLGIHSCVAKPFYIPSDTMMRSEEHTSELQSLMRISYAVFCLKKKNKE